MSLCSSGPVPGGTARDPGLAGETSVLTPESLKSMRSYKALGPFVQRILALSYSSGVSRRLVGLGGVSRELCAGNQAFTHFLPR